MNPNESIHPRVQSGRTVHPKSHTRGVAKKSVLLRKIEAITAHMERHPNACHASHLAKLTAKLPNADQNS
jgi:hypothetical protein